MKTITLIILLLIAPILSAQNWTFVKETNINVNNAVSVDIFTNKYGNNIIVQGSDQPPIGVPMHNLVSIIKHWHIDEE